MATPTLTLTQTPLKSLISSSSTTTSKTLNSSSSSKTLHPWVRNPSPSLPFYSKTSAAPFLLLRRRRSSWPAMRAMGSVDGEYSSKRSSSSEPRETIMLPGCDFNHWLIVMEFPKYPVPTREQMIDCYLNTLATVVGSMEEAKKSMYAFSTTTYTGFQCLVSEEISEKFKGLPGVLWVLPDSYIDVKNKDYGGDKYINGEIIPCTYQTYQPKQRSSSKYESRRYERRRDGPPPERKRPTQAAAPPQSASS